ncbi:MAG TPA: hypothetical protein PKM59_13470 [Thermodesulfobacteriota bacterium]|nr:hypothetical protein [Thermodesulfobacteriota bacterium]
MITTIHPSAKVSSERFPFGTIELLVFTVSILVLLGGCGGTKLYVPPEDPDAGTIAIVNDIYNPGFYVEIDEEDAGFLKNQREILVKPGRHTVKIFNKETAVADNALTTTHTFEFEIKVEENGNSLITLAWDDPNYRKKVENAAKSQREKEKEEKEGRRKTTPQRGTPY